MAPEKFSENYQNAIISQKPSENDPKIFETKVRSRRMQSIAQNVLSLFHYFDLLYPPETQEEIKGVGSGYDLEGGVLALFICLRFFYLENPKPCEAGLVSC